MQLVFLNNKLLLKALALAYCWPIEITLYIEWPIDHCTINKLYLM